MADVTTDVTATEEQDHKHSVGCIHALRVTLLRNVADLFEVMDESEDFCIECHVRALTVLNETLTNAQEDFEEGGHIESREVTDNEMELLNDLRGLIHEDKADMLILSRESPGVYMLKGRANGRVNGEAAK